MEDNDVSSTLTFYFIISLQLQRSVTFYSNGDMGREWLVPYSKDSRFLKRLR